jgi:hypothetical protein
MLDVPKSVCLHNHISPKHPQKTIDKIASLPHKDNLCTQISNSVYDLTLNLLVQHNLLEEYVHSFNSDTQHNREVSLSAKEQEYKFSLIHMSLLAVQYKSEF